MPYNRVERRVAALLDAAPGLRAFAKAGYQRFNYLVHGGRREALRLHPAVSLEPAVESGGDEECFYGYFGQQPWSDYDAFRKLFSQQGTVFSVAFFLYRERGRPRVLGFF